MKVVMLEYFLPYSIYTLEYCSKLSHYCDVILICKDDFDPSGVSKDLVADYKIYNILHTHSTNPVNALMGYLRDLIKISSIVKKEKPDIFHAQGVVHETFEEMLIHLIKKNAKKCCFTVHNLLSHEKKAGERDRTEKWYSYFDGLIVHNEESKKLLEQMYHYEGAVSVMPHGAYTNYGSRERSEPQIYKVKDKKIFLEFGIIREYKGVDILLDALALLPQEIRTQIKVVIAGKPGSGYSFDVEKRVDELQLQDCVELFLRRIEDDEMDALFEDVDCCLYPYRQIYTSGALLMAYAYGLPVIASDIPVFKEETDNGNAGLLFKAEDPESLKDTIIKFVNMDVTGIESLRNHVRELRDGKYNWINCAKKASDFYKELLETEG